MKNHAHDAKKRAHDAAMSTIPTPNPNTVQYLVPKRLSNYCPPTAGRTMISPTEVILATHSMAKAMGFRAGEGGT